MLRFSSHLHIYFFPSKLSEHQTNKETKTVIQNNEETLETMIWNKRIDL